MLVFPESNAGFRIKKLDSGVEDQLFRNINLEEG